MSPGHAAKFDSLQVVLHKHGALNSQEVDLDPVRPTRTGSVGQVLSIFRKCIAWMISEENTESKLSCQA